jgi:hypothetical protein
LPRLSLISRIYDENCYIIAFNKWKLLYITGKEREIKSLAENSPFEYSYCLGVT